MREVIAVCRSSKKARTNAARALDRYFWRIGDRTWRGQASNACLERVAADLREKATRNTAVMIQEVRSSRDSRIPLVLVGSRSAFTAEGVVPVASHPAAGRRRSPMTEVEASQRAVVQIAALFHDFGKATVMFQSKLAKSMATGQAVADAVRHEAFSAMVWDVAVAGVSDDGLCDRLLSLGFVDLDAASRLASSLIVRAFQERRDRGEKGASVSMGLGFDRSPNSLSFDIGSLILSHHRLPSSNDAFARYAVDEHFDVSDVLDPFFLSISPGVPFWHEDWWLTALRSAARSLRPGMASLGLDMSLRTCLMMADHVASSQSKISPIASEYLANTRSLPESTKSLPADSLSDHVRKVHAKVRGSFDAFVRSRDRYPGLFENEMPPEVVYPLPSHPRFFWQADAAVAARSLASSSPGGFFACILSGTGSGKTRGAPTILAGATFGDAVPERRVFRMTLGLGLRSLASQSATEYIKDVGFTDRSVSLLVGRPPINFDDAEIEGPPGSESMMAVPEWLRVERAFRDVPIPGSDEEAAWLQGLSKDTDRQLPAFCSECLEGAGRKASQMRLMFDSPVLVATVDHVMGVASPLRSGFLPQAVRVFTSDLVLDEIDQFDPEDLAALCRLAFQVGAAGRRLVIMSATLPLDVAESFFRSYRAGWSEHARATGVHDGVNLLCTGDAPGSCFVAANAGSASEAYSPCQRVLVDALAVVPAYRRGSIMPAADDWHALVSQIDESCSGLHDVNHSVVAGLRVSIGLVRMTRIAHTVALAAQLPAGLSRPGRLRLKVCLHSQFFRLHRDWIESRFKLALNRKGDHPDAGIATLIRETGALRKAVECGATDMEIVVVCSPVIETGNDLDFDYAIVDPISMRSVVQAAGRVNRHRLYVVEEPNVLLLGTPVIAMQHGTLMRPGVETRPHDDTLVTGYSLAVFEGRLTEDLIGSGNIAVLNAKVLLSDGHVVPLRDAETEVRRKMTSSSNEDPNSRYLSGGVSRMSKLMSIRRRFRRSDSKDSRFSFFGEVFDDASWNYDEHPGSRKSDFRPASVGDASTSCPAVDFLFVDLTRQAWLALGKHLESMSVHDMKAMLFVDVPRYGDVVPVVSYSEALGLFRGVPEDLFLAFGKRSSNQ